MYKRNKERTRLLEIINIRTFPCPSFGQPEVVMEVGARGEISASSLPPYLLVPFQ
jgi:hypothetical protein